MKVVIIGAGNVASVFGRLILKANHEIIQVVSRSIANAKILASELGCAYSDDPKILDNAADIYLVAMADAALNEIHESYLLGDHLIVHTAGSISKEILSKVSSRYGVMYPLQSLRKENLELHQDIPLLIDGNSDEAIALIEETALRLRYHLPGEMQTGPAIRKDIVTLDKHLRILNAYPALKKIYLKVTDSIMNP